MMKRLILTNDSSAAGNVALARLADFVVALERRFIWGPSPPDAELAAFFGARKRRPHWLDYSAQWRLESTGSMSLGLIELCARFDTIELWIDPHPNDQLQLVCLLDYLQRHLEIASKLTLVQANVAIGNQSPEELAQWRLSAARIRNDHFEMAGRAWRAFGAPTPQDWFGLLAKDLSVLPRLRQAVTELLEELPWRATGLGATEMLILQLISEGWTHPFDVFPGHEKPNTRRVFDYWEAGELLDRLAHGPAPAVSGLEEGPFTLEMHDNRSRHQRYKQSMLSLTSLGEAILAGRENFSRHNPIHRWWGGTELTNGSLWRWDPDRGELVAP